MAERDFSCPHCSDLSFAFGFARAAFSRDGRTLDLIHRLKYGGELHLAADLGEATCEVFSDPRLAACLAEQWPLVPVPLHRSRLRKRQFNQAAEIALGISQLASLPVAELLRRTRDTGTQTHLSRRERLKNLKGAFEISPKVETSALARLPGALLIDDVFTTGSTVHECAKVLKMAGVPRVAVITVMRG